MTSYDELGQVWQSFLMFFHEPNFTSKCLNTDSLGFRFNYFDNISYTVADLDHYNEKISIFAGGSCAFGVGATSDKHTIPSLLSERLQHLTLNLGGRAYSSTQELILFNQVAFKYKRIENVILMSGLNDLYLSQFRNYGSYFGPFFYSRLFYESMNQFSLSTKQRIIKNFLWPFYKNKLNYHKINKNNLLPLNKNIEIGKPEKEVFQTLDVDYAIAELKKNLYIWKKLSESCQFKLTYILQPFANWMDKPPSSQEKKLFEYLDNSDKSKTINLLNKNLYLDYSKKIKILCQHLGIEFYNLNSILTNHVKMDNWIFVDRAHLTDYGNNVVADSIYNILKN
jgi:hypothetical protein